MFIPLTYGAFSLIFLHLKLHYLSPWQYFRQIKRNNSINCSFQFMVLVSGSLLCYRPSIYLSRREERRVIDRGRFPTMSTIFTSKVRHIWNSNVQGRNGRTCTCMNNKWIQFSMKKVVIFLSLLLQFRNQYWSEKRENQPNNGITF